MAVHKIRKISSWTLLFSLIITVVILGMFYFGGAVKMEQYEEPVPVYTTLLLNWCYVLCGVTVVCTLLFALFQFFNLLKENPKAAMRSLLGIAAFAALLGASYAIGNDTPLAIPGYDGEENTPFYNKLTDMWLYSSYVLTLLIILSVAAGSVKRFLSK